MKAQINPKVIIEPDLKYIENHPHMVESLVREITEDAKRHVDGIRDIYTEWGYACGFCGCPWETALEDGAPVCCGEALEEYEKEPTQ